MTEAITLDDLVEEYQEYHHALLGCDPSASEYALEDFIEIQQWGEDLDKAAREMGLTIEEIEVKADV